MAARIKMRGAKITQLFNAKGLYFLYFMALGAFLPFINLYYERIGLSGVQIGTLAALPVIISATVTFLWGTIADALRLHRTILRAAFLLSPIFVFMLSRAEKFTDLIPWVVAYAIVTSPIIPLLDSNALEVVKERQHSYGQMRLWGSIGWAISTWAVGILIGTYNIRWLFYSYIVLIGATFLISLLQSNEKRIQKPSLAGGLRELFHRDFIVFLLSIFFVTTASSGVNSFFSLYLDQIGAGEGMIGLSWSLAALSEIPVMIFSAMILQRIGSEGLIRFAFIGYVVRWLLFSVIDIPGWALVVQMLNGPCFAAYLVGAVTFVSERTPEGLSATALAIFNTVAYGIASMIGSLVGGYLYDTAGMTSLLRIFSVIGLLGLIVFQMTGKRKVVLAER